MAQTNGNAEEKVWTPGENAPDTLTPNLSREVSCSIGEKGGISVYGINSFRPVTLYAQQWIDLLARASAILAFIADNKHACAWKDKAGKTASGRTRLATPDNPLVAMLMASGKLTREQAEELAAAAS